MFGMNSHTTKDSECLSTFVGPFGAELVVSLRMRLGGVGPQKSDWRYLGI
jgi:hypothetical protein